MPPVAAILGAAALTAFGGAAATATFLGISVFAAGALLFGASAALGFASLHLGPKPQTPEFGALAGFPQEAAGRLVQQRSAVGVRDYVIGEVRKSGHVVYFGSSNSNKFFHVVLQLHEGEAQSIGTVFLDDYPIHNDMLDGVGLVNAGKYNGKVRIKKLLGLSTQAADADLVAELGEWTTNHRLRSIAYIYVRYEYVQDLFPGALPNLTALIKGAKLFDTRDSVTRWAPNPALGIRDYLTRSHDALGMERPTTEVNATFVDAAANVCDEFVATQDVALTVTTVDPTDDTLAFGDDRLKVQTGDRGQMTTTGTLPAGLAVLTDYFSIVVKTEKNDVASIEIKLATTYANALAEVAIDITDTGTGTHTFTKKAEPRYTVNGVIKSDVDPGRIVEELMQAMAGRIPHISDTFHMLAGAFVSPTLTFDEDDLRGPLRYTTRLPRRDRFNAVRGIHTSPLNNWQPSDYPPYKDATYQTDDGGERIYKTLHLPFTSRAHTCQRIAKIALERSRQEIVCHRVPFKITAFQVQPGDVINFDNARAGFVGKDFEVGITWPVQYDVDGVPAVGVDHTLLETASAVFDWASGDETAVDPAPNSTLPDAFIVFAPAGFGLTTLSFLADNGQEFNFIKASWTVPTDSYVLNGGKTEAQFKRSADVTWIPVQPVEGDQTEVRIGPEEKGIDFDVRVRHINYIGHRSNFQTVSTFRLGSASGGADELINLGAVTDPHQRIWDRGGVTETVDKTLDFGGVT